MVFYLYKQLYVNQRILNTIGFVNIEISLANIK